jgi:hypothetical protein
MKDIVDKKCSEKKNDWRGGQTSRAVAMRFGFSFGFGVRFVEVVVVVVVRCGAGENDPVEGEVGREDLDGKI